MYEIALSVAACARSGTRADVAWMIAPHASDEAIAFTPGGGRIGGLSNGAFDGLLADVAARQLAAGRLVSHEVTALESTVCGLPEGSPVAFLVVPAVQFPADLWPRLVARDAVSVSVELSGDEVVAVGIDETHESVSTVNRDEHGVTTVLVPLRRLVIAGGGPMAEALAAQGRLLGWRVAVDGRPDAVLGLTATLSWRDAVVVLGHDVESSSRCLMAALESDAGYIGAVGSRAMQQSRGDWLAYRDVTDLSRVHGPAGLDLGGSEPAEVALAICAQIIAESPR